MICEHEPWDERIESHIDDIHGEVARDIQSAIRNITLSSITDLTRPATLFGDVALRLA